MQQDATRFRRAKPRSWGKTGLLGLIPLRRNPQTSLLTSSDRIWAWAQEDALHDSLSSYLCLFSVAHKLNVAMTIWIARIGCYGYQQGWLVVSCGHRLKLSLLLLFHYPFFIILCNEGWIAKTWYYIDEDFESATRYLISLFWGRTRRSDAGAADLNDNYK